MRTTATRWVFGATTILVIAALIVQIPVTAGNEDSYFTTPAAR